MMEICIDIIKAGVVLSQHMKMLTIRIPEELHKAFKLKCVSEGVDMGGVIAKLIEEYVRESKSKKK